MRNFHSINEALLVLLPKSSKAASMKDYMPILLIHLLGKLFSKVLANRLAPKLSSLVHPAQSAFIKGRCIQDNFKVIQATTRMLHSKRIPSMFLKVCISRAFNFVIWPYLLEVLCHVGFPPVWLDWVSTLLSTASTWVLLNSCPSNHICHTRGLCQGDPLSPMLFLIVMEVLHAMIHKSDDWSLFQHVGPRRLPHHVSLYADNMVMFVCPTLSNLLHARNVFLAFTGASGLGCNLAKC
jgi:hypothetical protein